MVTLSNGPDLAQHNVSYVGNRAPLEATPFLKLPVGAIKPTGWLLETLKRQRNGLCGNLGKISAWLQKDHNAWLSPDGKGEWGWEELPYWLKGYANMGYILGDKDVISDANTWLEGILHSQRPDGDFGPTFTDDKGVEDFWPKMLVLYCLQSHYEYTGDQRVIGFMSKYFQYQLAYPEDKFMQQYWQSRRSGDNLHSVLWLYNITGEPSLLQLAEKLHRKGVQWAPRLESPDDWYKSLPDWHNVNVAQGFREPAVYSQLSGKPTDLRASYDAFKTIREHFGQVPGGMFGADEIARPGYADPRQAIETCGMVEQMNSDEELLRITGDVFWADHAEDVAFNSYPAALMPDMRSLRYLTSPNMVLNDDKNHAPGINNEGPFLMMNPFSSRCCQHNHAQGWTYFSENLWQATTDNGVAAVLYASSEATIKVADGKLAKFSMTSNYPFEDRLRFRVHLDGPTTFPFYLRVPGWCSDPQLTLNGRRVTASEGSGSYLRIERTWKDGDLVTLRLPMRLGLQEWTENHHSVSVNYGPLTFSLKIGEDYVRKDSVATAIGDSKWQPGADTKLWPSFEIHPTTPWNIGLALDKRGADASFAIHRRAWPKDNYPFTQQATPIWLTAKGRQIPEWKIDEHGLCGVLEDSPVATLQPLKTVQLIPMGAARLRISAFPTTKEQTH